MSRKYFISKTMKRIFSLFAIVIALTAVGLTSCDSSEDVISEPVEKLPDAELTKLYNSIDSLQKVYSIPESRVDLDKWGRRGLFYAVDGVVGLLFAETGPFTGIISVVGSGLYEDYLDYMVSRCNTMDRKHRRNSQDESSIKTIVFPVENATFVDSIGYYHNLIIHEVRSNGKSYTDNSGNINFSAYYEDVFVVARKYGIQNNHPINTQLLFQYLESIIKPVAQLDVNGGDDINSKLLLSIFFNNNYNDFNYDTAKTSLHRDICEKIIYNCANIRDDQLVEYGTKVNDIIVNSHLDANTKDDLKIANNITVNSSLQWSNE